MGRGQRIASAVSGGPNRYPPPQTLGDKLQRLAFMAPHYLVVLERLVDQILCVVQRGQA